MRKKEKGTARNNSKQTERQTDLITQEPDQIGEVRDSRAIQDESSHGDIVHSIDVERQVTNSGTYLREKRRRG
jgi:hypothetical protein